MTYVGEARFRFKGDPAECARYVHMARVLVERVSAMYNIGGGGADAATHTTRLADGAVIRVTVFVQVPPIITITPALPEKRDKRQLYKWLCANGLYVDEDIKTDTTPGHNERTADAGKTFVVATLPPDDPETTHKRLQLVDNKFDPEGDYALRKGTPTEGISIVPIVTPIGSAYRSGYKGLVCFTELGQVGFYWKTILPINEGDINAEPTWYKCFLRTNIEEENSREGLGPITYATPAFTNPPTRVPDAIGIPFDHNTLFREIGITIVVDYFSTTTNILTEENLLDTRKYEIFIDEQPAPVFTGEKQLVAGRIRIVEVFETSLVFTMSMGQVFTYPGTFSWAGGTEFLRDMVRDTCDITINDDGTHEVNNVWDAYRGFYLWAGNGEEYPIYKSPMRGTVIRIPAYPATELFEDTTATWHVLYTETRESSVAGGREIVTASVTVELILLPNPAPTYTNTSSGSVANGTYTATLYRVNPIGNARYGPDTFEDPYTYTLLPEKQTKYGVCKVDVDVVTTNTVADKNIAKSSAGSIQWSRPEGGNDFVVDSVTYPGTLDTEHTRDWAHTSAISVHVTAFGVTYTVTTQRDITYVITEQTSLTWTGHTTDPLGGAATGMFYDLNTPSSFTSSTHNHDIEGINIPVEPDSLSVNVSNTEVALYAPYTAAYIDDGVLFVEYDVDHHYPETPLSRAVSLPGRERHYGRKWAFTTAGEKFVMQGYATTDPTDQVQVYDLAHNPDTGQTYKMVAGDPYACMRQVTTPLKYRSGDKFVPLEEVVVQSYSEGQMLTREDTTDD